MFDYQDLATTSHQHSYVTNSDTTGCAIANGDCPHQRQKRKKPEPNVLQFFPLPLRLEGKKALTTQDVLTRDWLNK